MKYEKLHKSLLSDNNPKTEINFTLLDQENYVTTNTNILIIEKHSDFVENNLLLHLSTNKKVDNYLSNRPEVFLHGSYKAIEEKRVGKFPEYTRIIKNGFEDKLNFKSAWGNADNLYQYLLSVCFKHGVIFNILLNEKFYKELQKITLDKKSNVSYIFDGINSPLQLNYDNLKIIIMPFIAGLE